MLIQVIYLFVCLLKQVKSDSIHDATWRDMKNNIVRYPEYCLKSKSKNCLAKCCPEGYMLSEESCVKAPVIDYTQFHVFKINNDTVIQTNETLKSWFAFVQNDALSDLSRTVPVTWPCESYILEDGALSKCDDVFSQLTFCFDFIFQNKNTTSDKQNKLELSIRFYDQQASDGHSRNTYIIVGLSISSFFCILVLVVYFLIGQHKKLAGLMRIAYIFTFILTCIIKIVQITGYAAGLFPEEACRHLSPAVYYIILATFFWLNAMSIDVWSAMTNSIPLVRGKMTAEDRRLFCNYCLYAWLTPALITLLVVAVDRFELYASDAYKPPFQSCFTNEKQTQLYLHLPIGILIVANILLFGITSYTVWIIKAKVNNNAESRNTKKNENIFFICLKIFILMGVNWILELLPNDLPPALFYTLNFYNLFVGVAIFYVLVCQKDVIIELCRRLKINNRYVNSFQASQTKSEATNSTKLGTTSESKRLTLSEKRNSKREENYSPREDVEKWP